MHDPFKLLGVPRDADEATIRRRYLELVRESPPDRDPDRFAAIREAYDRVRDPASRLERMLFHVASGESIEDIMSDLRARMRAARVPLDVLPLLAEQP